MWNFPAVCQHINLITIIRGQYATDVFPARFTAPKGLENLINAAAHPKVDAYSEQLAAFSDKCQSDREKHHNLQNS